MENRSLTSRLNRIEGQIRAIRRMIAQSDDCEKILQQISAVRAALFKVAVICLSDSVAENSDASSDEYNGRIKNIDNLLGIISGY